MKRSLLMVPVFVGLVGFAMAEDQKPSRVESMDGKWKIVGLTAKERWFNLMSVSPPIKGGVMEFAADGKTNQGESWVYDKKDGILSVKTLGVTMNFLVAQEGDNVMLTYSIFPYSATYKLQKIDDPVDVKRISFDDEATDK